MENETVNTIVTRSDKTVVFGQNVRSTNGAEYKYPIPILYYDFLRRFSYSEECRWKNYFYLNHPIFAFGVENFLSYAAHFCKYETQNGSLEIIFIGSGNGTIKNDIIAAYVNHFGGELSITLIDPNPEYRVDFPQWKI